LTEAEQLSLFPDLRGRLQLAQALISEVVDICAGADLDVGRIEFTRITEDGYQLTIQPHAAQQFGATYTFYRGEVTENEAPGAFSRAPVEDQVE
jgi:hypothetical protein